MGIRLVDIPGSYYLDFSMQEVLLSGPSVWEVNAAACAHTSGAWLRSY